MAHSGHPDKQPAKRRIWRFAAALPDRDDRSVAIGVARRGSGPEPQGGEASQIFTILTPPNGPNGAIHDRMRAILRREEWPMWLREGEATADQLLGVLRPFFSGLIHAYRSIGVSAI